MHVTHVGALCLASLISFPTLTQEAEFEIPIDPEHPLSCFPSQVGGKFAGRGRGRKALGRIGRGELAKAIEAGLRWLVTHQSKDGGWQPKRFTRLCLPDSPCKGAATGASDVELTSLALMALLGDGSTMRSGPYKASVKKAVIWLKNQQNEKTGLIGPAGESMHVHDHAIATIALTEAYGLSRYRVLKRYAQRAVDFLFESRNNDWGWSADGSGPAHPATTCWAIQALTVAEDFRLQLPDGFRGESAAWLDKHTDATTGVVVSKGKPQQSSQVRAAHGAWTRFLIGQDKGTAAIISTAELLSKRPPRQGNGAEPMLWLHGSYTNYQLGGRHWKTWSNRLTDTMLETQRTGDHTGGSWDPQGKDGMRGGRVYMTTLCVLSLEVYYRYTRLIR